MFGVLDCYSVAGGECATCSGSFDNCTSCDSPLYLNSDTPVDNCIPVCPVNIIINK